MPDKCQVASYAWIGGMKMKGEKLLASELCAV